MRVLITGAMGFSGQGLYKVLIKNKALSIFISDIHINKADNYFDCDLTNFPSVTKLIKTVKPNQVFHFSGSFSNEFCKDFEINVLATKNLLESIKNSNLSCRILLVGSAAEYGNVSLNNDSIKESQLLNPISFYGLTKVFQTNLMSYYVNAYSMDIVMARPFNIYGKNISENLFVGKVYQQIKLLKEGKIEKIVLGNLENRRDYISLKDTLIHYITIMKRGESGQIYNVGNGVSIKTKQILDKILDEENIDPSLVESRISQHPEKPDIENICANITKLKNLKK